MLASLRRVFTRLTRTEHPARLWPLAAVAAGVVTLGALGVLPRWPGLVHLVALPPLDLFTDVRVLVTEASSVPAFALTLAVVLALRITVLALLLGGVTRDRLRFAALFYLSALPVMVLLAALDFAAYAILYARLFWPAVGMLALVVLVAGPAPWQVIATGPRRLSTALARSARAGFRLPVLVPYAAVLIGIGALADLGGQPAAVALVPVSAVATAVAIRQLSRPAAGRPLVRLAVATAVAVVLGTGFVLTRGAEQPATAPPQAGSLLLMSGVDSSSGSGSIFETDVEVLGYTCDQVYYFSYAGTGDGAPQGDATCPIRTGAPYEPDDTLRPVAEQVEFFSAQVQDLPRPLVVAGHSLAAWIAWEAVASGQAPQVDVLILVGPFPDSPVTYPPPDRHGTGRVGGDLMRALMPLAAVLGLEFDPDAPAARALPGTRGSPRPAGKPCLLR